MYLLDVTYFSQSQSNRVSFVLRPAILTYLYRKMGLANSIVEKNQRQKINRSNHSSPNLLQKEELAIERARDYRLAWVGQLAV